METSPHCTKKQRKAAAGSGNPPWCDFRLAVESRDALKSFVDQGHVTIERLGKDAYGRTLAKIFVNGRDAGEYLMRWGFARRWTY
ncbi:thermonuclease family protein [Novosphingobium gossypii]|uniref:thermonuclease family protein n=1 Tax=Novosphingobium gossypii TaxID=1604774 RepID=UPI003D2362D1